MPAMALEIAADGVTALREGGQPVSEPAFALLEGNEITTGEAARKLFRIRPRQVQSRFWDQLGEDEIPGTAFLQADLAHAQLEALWARCSQDVDAVYLVAPDSYDREQLGLLLGLAEDCQLPVHGMAPASVAASTRTAPDRQLIHLDAGLSSFTASVVDQGRQLRRGRQIRLPSVGLDTLRDAWTRMIGQSFVDATRFDPFHDASSEQALFEALPGWLASIGDEPVTLSLDYQGKQFETRVEPYEVIAAAEAPYRVLQQLVSSLREPGQALVVQLSERLAQLPGLAAALGRLGETHVVTLAPASGARGALARREEFARRNGALVLTQALSAVDEPFEASQDDMATPAPAPSSGQENDQRATHVVWRGVAHALNATALVIGTATEAEQGAERVLALPPETSGVSARHCQLRLLDDTAIVTDMSRYGTFVNGRRVGPETRLVPGDVLRVGMPGEELLMIRLA